MYKCLASDDLYSYVVLENVDKAQMKIRSRKENVAGNYECGHVMQNNLR